jgi:hypothetical protein
VVAAVADGSVTKWASATISPLTSTKSGRARRSESTNTALAVTEVGTAGFLRALKVRKRGN